MRRAGRSPGSGGKVFPLLLCFFGLFMILAVGVMAQSNAAASIDADTAPENYENLNQSMNIVQPFQIGWTGMMLFAMILAVIAALLLLTRRLP